MKGDAIPKKVLEKVEDRRVELPTVLWEDCVRGNVQKRGVKN